jgi:hypothetical protein
MSLPEQSTMVENILNIFQRATHDEVNVGLHWYGAANAFAVGLARKHTRKGRPITVRQAAGVIAVLSPQLSWEVNMTCAESMLKTGTCSGPYNSNKEKAARIIAGEDPWDVMSLRKRSGHKSRAFFLCINHPELEYDAVCVDRHAFAVALGRHYNKVERGRMLSRAGVYERIEEAYVEAARRLCLMPHQVQAVTWVAWRALHPSEGELEDE